MEQVCRSFVRALLDDVHEGFAQLIGKVREFDRENRIPPTETLSPEEFALALFSLELQALPNLFETALAQRIRNVSVSQLAESLGKNESEIEPHLSLYESVWSQHVSAGMNPLVGLSETLYGRLGIPEFKSDKFPRITGPDPIIVTALATVLATGTGRWKTLSDNFSIG